MVYTLSINEAVAISSRFSVVGFGTLWYGCYCVIIKCVFEIVESKVDRSTKTGDIFHGTFSPICLYNQFIAMYRWFDIPRVRSQRG